jgi:hypothetical protein
MIRPIRGEGGGGEKEERKNLENMSTALGILQKAKFRPDDAERLICSDNSMKALCNDEYRCKFTGLPRPDLL